MAGNLSGVPIRAGNRRNIWLLQRQSVDRWIRPYLHYRMKIISGFTAEQKYLSVNRLKCCAHLFGVISSHGGSLLREVEMRHDD